MAIHYLGKSAFAERIGVKPDSLNRLKLPPEDAKIGDIRGWLPETIDQWIERRPGSGKVSNERWHLPPELQ
ncbi:XRE family transcriptional regulator [Nocardia wallacei]|uniref:XRE family transcriptional regulator n=1 Tax=Nocardia wallacei TaxID=480035 RepID=UPI002458C935|nr:XRE family transcriptional regulator [Nocardia wallacei]